MAQMTFLHWFVARRRLQLTWFFPTFTPHGQKIPPRLGKRTIGFLALIPLSILWTIVIQQPWILMANGVILILVVIDNWFTEDWFRLGMSAGRREVMMQMITEWEADDAKSPNAWLMREAELLKATEEYSAR